MTNDHATHLQAILDSAIKAATTQATAANIAAVERARKALDDFQSNSATESAGETFATQTAALEYLQRKWQIEKSKLSKDVGSGRVPKKDGLFTAKDLDFYAEAVHLKPKTIEYGPIADGGDRLKTAMAEEREFRVGILKGEYINAAEEEARDAKLWGAIKSDLENHAPAIVHELINRLLPIIEDDDVRAKVLSVAHELRLTYEDAIADIFDRYAKDGGIEA